MTMYKLHYKDRREESNSQSKQFHSTGDFQPPAEIISGFMLIILGFFFRGKGSDLGITHLVLQLSHAVQSCSQNQSALKNYVFLVVRLPIGLTEK